MIFEPKKRPEVKEIKYGDLIITNEDQYIVSRVLTPAKQYKLLISLSDDIAFEVNKETDIVEFIKEEFYEIVESIISRENLRLMEV